MSKKRESIVPGIMQGVGLAGIVDAINKLEQAIRLTSSYLFSDSETPTGTIDGANKVFTVANTPDPVLSLRIYLNGMYQTPAGEDYTLDGITITFVNAPATGSILRVGYRYK